MAPDDHARRDEFDLHRADPLLDIIVRNAPIVLFSTDAEGVLTLSRGRALAAMGLAEGELVGRSVFDLYTEEPAIADAARRALEGQEVTVPLRLGDVWHETLFAPIRDAQGRVAGIVGVATDITERVHAQETLRRRLAFDEATGLANRTHFTEIVDEAITAARHAGLAVAVIAVRLTHYRDIANAMGHATAEQAAAATAQRIVAQMPERATAGRLDSGRFAVLLPDASPSETIRLAHAIVRALEDPVFGNGQRLEVQPCAGVAMFPGHANAADALIRHAEAALPTADRGVDRVEFYVPTRAALQAENLRLLADLQRALDRGEVELAFQPVVNLQTAEVTGVEALARWSHDDLGAIPPDRFVALAESSGLIRPLTTYVLETAARQARAWQDAGLRLQVAVNISPWDVLDARFVGEVEGILGAWGVAADRLTLEVTERAVIQDPRAARERLQALAASGVHIAIDDFGTGNSNLTMLKELPFHNVKIDQSFVRELPGSAVDAAIVSSVVNLAMVMGQNTTAEGVETPEVWDALIDLGCEAAQGYHIARPMPGSQMAAWLGSGPWTVRSASA